MRHLVLGIACASAITSQTFADVKEPGFKINGRTASELSADWWQWAMSTPTEINPVSDTSGTHCEVGQKGNIWFLAGGFGSSKIQRKCTIPEGQYIFFPIINMSYWPQGEGNGFTCEQAKAAAALNNDSALELFVDINGVSLENPKQYRARTDKCFNIYQKVPKELSPYNAYPSASDGYWILLEPLQKGVHHIKFGGRYNQPGNPYGRMVQDIEYEILVQ